MTAHPKIHQRLLLPAFAAHSFGIEPSHETPNLHIPCVHSSPAGWDFDYVPLLLADKLVMDKISVDFIKSSGLPAHSRLREAINVMTGEGVLEAPIDGAAIIQRHQQELNLCNQAELGSPVAWRPEVRAAIEGWKEPGARLAGCNGNAHKESQLIPFGIWLLGKRHGMQFTQSELQRIESILSDQKTSFTADEDATLREVVSAYVTVVHQNLLLAREANAAVFDGANLQPLYHQKLLKSCLIPGADLPVQTQRSLDKMRQLFSLAIPSYAPRDVAEFVALHKDSRRAHLRELILEASASDRALDAAFFEKVQQDYVLATRSAERVRNIFWLVTRPLALFPPTHLALLAVEKAADMAIEHQKLKAHQWHLFLVEQRARIRLKL
jgi:hypothetical protein